MSVLGRRLQNFLQRKGKGRYGHMQEVQGVPFYEARQPWWANFIWGFIAADLLVTGPCYPKSPVTRLCDAPPGNAPDCLGHLSLGVGFATLLLIARSCVVRILHIIHLSAGAPKQLLVAGAHRHGTRGAVVPFSRTRIDPGRDEWK
ncbi:hypothetical protein BJV78DRAFT_1280022 [Lactifluus subvellereus]|nr:hypothetical protein BJV78DRAFT_1280022 [Lactifluus subvellereus]